MGTEAAPQFNLPPCGGDVRQGRGGWHLNKQLPLMFAEPSLPPSVTFGDISPTRREIIGSLSRRRAPETVSAPAGLYQ